MTEPPVRIVVDAARNLLRVRLRETGGVPAPVTLPAIVDVGEGGRLLGLEVDVAADPRLGAPWQTGSESPAVAYEPATATLYVALADGATAQARSAAVAAVALVDDEGAIAEIAIPRRGEGFEITFPSGNQ